MKYISYVFVLGYGFICCFAHIEDQLLELENVVENQFADNEKMKRRAVELEEEVAILLAENMVNSEELREYETVNEKRDFRTEQLFTRAAGTSKAFQAYRSGTRCYNDHEIIVFDVEALDTDGYGDAGMYDTKDGIFEPPKTGTYVFTWTVATPLQTKVVTELVIGGQMEGVLRADSDTSHANASGIHPATAVVVAQVNAGTHCYIRVRHTTSECVMVLSDASQVRTTFSGWQLY